KIQGKWAKHYGCDDGTDAGANLHDRLRSAWKHSDVDGVLHIMQDRDLEETYHALFMQEALEAAGIETRTIHGVAGLNWDGDGNIRDGDGTPIKWVWKTWAWETALDQIRAECNDDEQRLAQYRPGARHEGPPWLVDVLLRKEVMVYEPLWTLIPSNKAILPVMSAMFPTHRYLLHSSYELTDELAAQGYVVKPIVGRGGSNISMYGRDERLLGETGGAFENRAQIYQELFKLPFVGGYNAQISTFTAAGKYAGAGVRVDSSLIINLDSDNLALRIVDDDDLLDHA
ncbi:MAG TPA: glutathionylspermidine synthase family protein, partial [Gammaproteobacteria bacterium]|nr:glutathionylspermidine synthase family protein [Gammaproteobacteria bacterium]